LLLTVVVTRFVIGLELVSRMVYCGDVCGSPFLLRLAFFALAVVVGSFCYGPVNVLTLRPRYLPVVVEHPDLFDVDVRPIVAAFDMVTCEASYDRQVFEKCLLHDSNLVEYAAAKNMSWRSVSSVSVANPCSLRLWRGTLVACGSPVARLCSCVEKRTIAVEEVVFSAQFEKLPTFLLFRQIVAVADKFPDVRGGHPAYASDSNASASLSQARTDRNASHFLVDASSFQFSSLPCRDGKSVSKDDLGPAVAYLSELRNQEARAFDHVTVLPAAVSRQAATGNAAAPTTSYSCAALRRHPLAHHNFDDMVDSATDARRMRHYVVRTAVYYSLNNFAGVAGHAVDVLMEGIAQYLRSGLHKSRIPWLVPCSDEWDAARGDAPLLWTKFFFDLNEVLQFPFYLVDVYKHLDADVRHATLRFRQVHFAATHGGVNALCLKPVLRAVFSPVVSGTNTRWSPQHHVSLVTTTSSGTGCGICVAFIKYNTASNGTITTHRGFSPSSRFDAILSRQGVQQYGANLPLLQRMWLVNRADLIVTTWGSTLGILMNLMFERTSPIPLNATVNTTGAAHLAERRMLVLIHPTYCPEAHVFLNVPQRKLCKLRKVNPIITKLSSHLMSRREGTQNDFYGGAHFCVKYIFTQLLQSVQSHDFEFHCP
jgi:hypothetical protein